MYMYKSALVSNGSPVSICSKQRGPANCFLVKGSNKYQSKGWGTKRFYLQFHNSLPLSVLYIE